MSITKKFKPGWKPDVPDIRDYRFTSSFAKPQLPDKVDLRPLMPPILDQGDLGSCTAFAVGTGVHFLRKQRKAKPDFNPSHLFIYYNERVREGTVNEDAGAYIRTSIKTVAKDGFCREKYWPYIISKFTKKPTVKAYRDAVKNKAVEYYRIDNTDIDQLKGCLAAGYPFIFGFAIFESIDKADKTGHIPMPSQQEQMLGGHAVICCGYDDSTGNFIIHNSWGTELGDKGYFYMPYQYLTDINLSDDFWTVRGLGQPAWWKFWEFF